MIPADDAVPIDREATLIVTRPMPDAAALIDALRALGRKVLGFPVLSIGAVADSTALADTMSRIDDYRLVTFVSPNAIRQALAHRREPWPRDTTIGVMGPGSVDALARSGIEEPRHRVISPARTASTGGSVEGFDSEALFTALDATLHLSHDFEGRVLILRGNGGRGWFADRLRGLGIQVDEVEAYRRGMPAADPAASDQLRTLFAANAPVVFIVTSSEGVGHLVAMVEAVLADGARGPSAAARAWLFGAVVVAPHRRIAEKARQAGFPAVVLCAPGNRGIVAAIE